MKVYLKVKIKSLAEESKIIRKEENRVPKASPEFFGLRSHRKFDVRHEARSALLAYGFLRGVEYRNIESKTKRQPDLNRIIELVYKYGDYRGQRDGKKIAAEKVTEWRYKPLTNATVIC